MNTAQQIHEFIGVPVNVGGKQAHGNKNASATKAGPGRYHEAQHTKATPLKSKGAGRGFVQHINPDKRARRELVAAYGRRQALRAIKDHRAEVKAANDERTDARSTRHYESVEVS